MEIFKDRLQSGFSYALKPSVLVAALLDAGAATPVTLYQRHKKWWTEGVIFRADFYPPGRFHLNETEVLHVTSRSLPSKQRPQARKFIEQAVLPAFVAWLINIEALPSDSTVRREKQSFTRIWEPSEEPDAALG
jgi:hypothetical protein